MKIIDNNYVPQEYLRETSVEFDEEMAKNELNDLEKILSTYKLRPVKKCSVGFSKIASQIHRVSVLRGFQLNIMIIGNKGLGKSTFLNNLFHTQFPKNTQLSEVTESQTFLLNENGVRLRLKIIKAPNFGENIDNSECWKSIENYINKCFEKQLQQEQTVYRKAEDFVEDHLVHLCLYFIQPSSERCCLRDLDVEFMKSVHKKVNIVPLLAKADSFTQSELQLHKTNLLKELKTHSINYFKFSIPEDSGWKCDSSYLKYPDKKCIQRFIERFPFAVAAGTETMTVDNKLVTVRSYPWGSIQIDNMDHCDTLAARTLLLSTHLQELITKSHHVMYETFRSWFLEETCLNLGLAQWNDRHPTMYLEAYFKKMSWALEKKVEEMEKGFQELSSRKQDILLRKKKDVEYESVRMKEELRYLYSRFEEDFAYFVTDKTQWDCDNIEYHETCGTLKPNKRSRTNHLNIFKKSV